MTIFRMTQNTAKSWNGDIRIFLLHAVWRSNGYLLTNMQKMQWIIQMDNPRNTSTYVTISRETSTIEIGYERNLDGRIYTAGKRIKVDNFFIFRSIFYQN